MGNVLGGVWAVNRKKVLDCLCAELSVQLAYIVVGCCVKARPLLFTDINWLGCVSWVAHKLYHLTLTYM